MPSPEPYHLVRLEFRLKNGKTRYEIWRLLGESDEALHLEYSSGKPLTVKKKDIIRLSFTNPWRYCGRKLFAGTA